MCTYIYIYVARDRERETHTHTYIYRAIGFSSCDFAFRVPSESGSLGLSGFAVLGVGWQSGLGSGSCRVVYSASLGSGFIGFRGFGFGV